MSTPTLSICIPTYNRGHLLSDLLECLTLEVKGLTDSVEIVVCDNCSDDSTGEVVSSFMYHLNLRYYKNSRNIGIAANIFKVPDYAIGNYCWILGDDDLLVPGAIKTILGIIEQEQDLNGIVVGYTYEDIRIKNQIKYEKTPVPFRNPVFLNTSISEKIGIWDDTLLYSNVAALHTSIVSCVFRRSLWQESCSDNQFGELEPALSALNSTFPQTLVWARMFVGKPVYFISRPLVYFFVGEQEWFQSKWGAIIFSYGLELAQFFRRLGASAVAVNHYEDAILKQNEILLCLIESPNEYAKEHFSLDWLLGCYGDRPIFWSSLGSVLRKSKGRKKVQVWIKVAKAVIKYPVWWGNFLQLGFVEMTCIGKSSFRKVFGQCGNLIKGYFMKLIEKSFDNFRHLLSDTIHEALREKQLSSTKEQHSQAEQKLLMLQYQMMLHNKIPLPGFGEVGFRVFSENDEDGILLYIFSIIGFTNKNLVDIGATVGGSNTANLIVNHGWTGLLFEGEAERAAATNDFYKSCADTKNYPPKVLSEWVTRENIDALLTNNGVGGEIDLLSIDIDGVDYYIWESIQSVSPRVVVVEYQCIWGPEKSVSVPYSPDFEGGFDGRYGVYSGASLAAFVKLAKKKGYRLVGCHRYGYNAFFIRNDTGLELFPEIAPEECFKHPFTHWAQRELLPKVKDMEWVEI